MWHYLGVVVFGFCLFFSFGLVLVCLRQVDIRMDFSLYQFPCIASVTLRQGAEEKAGAGQSRISS